MPLLCISTIHPTPIVLPMTLPARYLPTAEVVYGLAHETVFLFTTKRKTSSTISFTRRDGKNTQVNSIVEYTPDQLLISTNNGLLLFNITRSEFVDNALSPALHTLEASTLSKQGCRGLYRYQQWSLCLLHSHKAARHGFQHAFQQAHPSRSKTIAHPSLGSYRGTRAVPVQPRKPKR